MSSEQEMSARVQRLEALMIDLVEGRIRTDFIFDRLEKQGIIPEGMVELGGKVVERHRLAADRENCSAQAIHRGVLSMRYGNRMREPDEQISRADEEILELARRIHRESTGE